MSFVTRWRPTHCGALWACLALAPLAAPELAARDYPPVKMEPTPPAKLRFLGSGEGMQLSPAKPVPGHPGVDPAAGRPVRGQPQLVSYPGSVEHYTPNSDYLPRVNPYNPRTLVRNLVAIDIPGVDSSLKEKFAEPVQVLLPGEGLWKEAIRTDERAAPVPVVRLKPKGQRLRFELGPLPTSLYVVRVIGALETDDVLEYPKNLIVEMKINDGVTGGMSHYILRGRGTDNFYPVVQFFFHVVDPRRFEVDIGLHPDSQVDLLVHNVEVHDELAECARLAGKRASLLAPPHILRTRWEGDPEEKLKPLREGQWAKVIDLATVQMRVKPLRATHPNTTDEELFAVWRQQRDDAIWNSLPPINVNLMGDEHSGVPRKILPTFSMTDPETEAKLRGQGLLPGKPGALPLGYALPEDFGPWRLAERATGGKDVYTLDDLAAHKPYPGLPFEAPAWGKRFEGKDVKAFFFSPLAQACGQALARPLRPLVGYLESGDMETGRDLALRLCRLAYDLPTIHPNRFFSRLVAPSLFAHQRWQPFRDYMDLLPIAREYDLLFSVIKDNQELARAVGRYIPWVKTPDDVVALLDTYVLQWSARQMAYWRQSWDDHGNAGRMAELAALQMAAHIAKPWVEFIFDRTWEAPLPPASVQDYMYLSTQRDGTTATGSSHHTGPGLVDAARWLELYVRNGGDITYDLSDPKRYPRVASGLSFDIDRRLAGMHHLAIGEGGGFCQEYGWNLLEEVRRHANVAWRWTRDPRFAYCAVHYGRRETETDVEWNDLVAATKGARNPFLSNRSRVLANWAGILEGGTASDDFRLRHAARVRVGWGEGHAYRDTMDLAIWSLGVPLNISSGAPEGCAEPEAGSSAGHNVVTVDGKDFQGHAWVEQLADMTRCRYLKARAPYQEEFSRQVALIELDEGRPAGLAPSDPSLAPGTKYGANVGFPQAYVLDVFRVVGGKEHCYNFHAFPDDQFSATVAPGKLTDKEKEFLSRYKLEGKDVHWGGPVEFDQLVTTWRLDRKGKSLEFPGRGACQAPPAEGKLLGINYDPDSPRKFLRVHLLGQRGSRMLTGEAIAAPYGTDGKHAQFQRHVHVVRTVPAQPASTLFVAIWEPYAGKPLIKSTRLEGNTGDASSYAAVHIETADGAKDLCFADSAASQIRSLAGGTRVQADFAYLSTDARGLRQASLVGGRALETPQIVIRPAVQQHSARAVAVDYAKRVATLDKALPGPLLDGTFFEVGAPQRGEHAAHWTTFEAVRVDALGSRTTVQWRKGADVFSGKIVDVARNADGAVVRTALAPPLIPGENTQLVATTKEHSRFWRCDVTPKPDYRGPNAVGGTLTLYGGQVREGDLEPGQRIYLYEFGTGDSWRAPSKVSLLRVRPDVYKVEANTPCEFTLVGGRVRWSTDGRMWHVLRAKDGKTDWELTEKHLATSALYLRWTPGT